jgi:hypothetical protein
MFAGAIRLAWQEKKHFYEYIILFSFMGFIGIIISLAVSFTPPASLKYGSLLHYDSLIIICLVFIASLSILWKKILFHKVIDKSLGKTSLANHISTH